MGGWKERVIIKVVINILNVNGPFWDAIIGALKAKRTKGCSEGMAVF